MCDPYMGTHVLQVFTQKLFLLNKSKHNKRETIVIPIKSVALIVHQLEPLEGFPPQTRTDQKISGAVFKQQNEQITTMT